MPDFGQQLWTRPVYPHPNDEEFDGLARDFSWSVRNMSDGVTGSFYFSGIDTYDTAFTTGNILRVELSGKHRPSWLLMQPPNKTFYVHRSYSPPTNVLILARMKFNQYSTTLASNDRTVGLLLLQDTGGIPDAANRVEVMLNESNGSTQAKKVKYTSGTPADSVETTDATQEGQALEYVAMQKLGTTYHMWAGTVSGNWVWLGSTSFTGTIAHLALYCKSNDTSNPGVGVVGVDFVRFYETDNFLF